MARINKTESGKAYVHKRGWGYEVWYANTPEYCGKSLVIYGGKKGSLHFHVKKDETMLLKSGHVVLSLIDPEKGEEYLVELWPGDSIRIPRGQPHQILGVEDSEIIEFSTEHFEDDSHRIRKGD